MTGPHRASLLAEQCESTGVGELIERASHASRSDVEAELFPQTNSPYVRKPAIRRALRTSCDQHRHVRSIFDRSGSRSTVHDPEPPKFSETGLFARLNRETSHLDLDLHSTDIAPPACNTVFRSRKHRRWREEWYTINIPSGHETRACVLL